MNQPVPRLSKLPFLIGDILLIAAAIYVAQFGQLLGQWQYVAIISALAFGAWLFAWPFVLEFRAATKIAEASALNDVTTKIGDLNKVTTSISSAILEWQHVQQSSTQFVTSAQHIAEQMTDEARRFGELMSKLHENEKNHLRLEVEKLRRVEGDWLGVTVRMLDHVHALHCAGLRSGSTGSTPRRRAVSRQAFWKLVSCSMTLRWPERSPAQCSAWTWSSIRTVTPSQSPSTRRSFSTSRRR